VYGKKNIIENKMCMYMGLGLGLGLGLGWGGEESTVENFVSCVYGVA